MATSAADRLRTRLLDPRIIIAPGVYDVLSAILAARAGFNLLFLSGWALSSSQLGRPDIGLLEVGGIADVLRRITDRVETPVLVDIDSGFGSVANVAATVRKMEQAGAAGVQIEDQVVVKPARALLSRPVVPLPDMLERLRIAQDARQDPAFFISARTDAMATLGFDEALCRAEAFVDAGADLIFVEGVVEQSRLEELTSRIDGRVPLIFNVLDDATRDQHDLEALGFRIVLHPRNAILHATAAIERALTALSTEKRAAGAVNASGMADILGTSEFLDALTTGAQTN